jgi:hypothetical protein
MSIRNRELSQFGSFIYVDNSNQEIGITTGVLPYVGIGTTNPSQKLTVVGNTNITGFVSASSYYLNGSPLVSAELQTWEFSGSNIYRSIGNVGIGSSSPGSKLTVAGSISATGIVSSTSNITAGGNVSATRFISTETTLAPFTVSSTATVSNLSAALLGGKSAPSGNIVGTTDTQTLTNKTLSGPNISTSTSINLGQNSTIIFEGSTVNVNKTTLSVVDPTATRTINLPNVSGTVLTTGNLTDIPSGSITSAMIVDGTITNSDIAVGASISYSKLNLNNSITSSDISSSSSISYGKLNLSNSIINSDISSSAAISVSKLSASTISGISLGNNLATLTFGTYLTGTSYNGSSAVTLGLNASSNDTSGNTVVVRTGGDFTSKSITATNFDSTSDYRVNSTVIINSGRNLINVVNGNFSGIVTCTDLNSQSDVNLKDNIQNINNSLDSINSLRGVTFNWKESGRPSIGVIAQEVEEVFPQLVMENNENKTVNYNGLIGVLIEAVKELSKEVEELKSQLNK